MSMRIQRKGGDNLTLISVYAPTMQRPQEEKKQFYEMLGSCVSAAEMDSVIILTTTQGPDVIWGETARLGYTTSCLT